MVLLLKIFGAALLLVALGVGVASATPFAYAVSQNDASPGTTSDLFTVDIQSGQKSLVGNTGVAFMESLALSPAGVLFGGDAQGRLYRINRTTGAATFIGATGLVGAATTSDIEGLDFNGNTLLAPNSVASPDTTTIFSINTSTAAPTPVVTATSALTWVRTLAVLDANTVLVRGNPPPNNILYAVNLTTGAVTTIGPLLVHGDDFAAMDFLSDGLLYGLDRDGSVWRIDPTTAGVILLGNTGGDSWLDMTTVSPAGVVPEPTTLLLFGTALAGLGWRLRRKK